MITDSCKRLTWQYSCVNFTCIDGNEPRMNFCSLHTFACSQFLAACPEPSLTPSCHHRMQLETNDGNGSMHKKLFKEKAQRRLERRQKYAARDPETIESQHKRRNERDRQTYAAMDKDEKNWEKYWNVSVPILTAGINIILDSSKESPISFSQMISSNPNL